MEEGKRGEWKGQLYRRKNREGGKEKAEREKVQRVGNITEKSREKWMTRGK